MHKLNGQKLIGGDIVSHLEHIETIQNTKNNYFKTESKLWQAMYNHISSCDADDCVLVKLERDPIRRNQPHKGIELVDIKVCDNGRLLRFDVKLTYAADEGHGREYSKNYQIFVPKELELEYSRVQFQAWLQGERVKMEQADRMHAISQLQVLVALYPLDTQRLLTAAKNEARVAAEKQQNLRRRRR